MTPGTLVLVPHGGGRSLVVSGINIRWGLGYGNGPWINLTVDRYPKIDEIEFHSLPVTERWNKGHFYYGRSGTFVYFLFHDPRDENGFGGRTYRLRMRDGAVATIKGPWSSSASMYNSIASPHCVEVAFHIPGDRTGFAGCVTVDCVNDALARFIHPDLRLRAYRGSVEVRLGDEVCHANADGTFGRLCNEKPGDGLIYRLSKGDAHLAGVTLCSEGDIVTVPNDGGRLGRRVARFERYCGDEARVRLWQPSCRGWSSPHKYRDDAPRPVPANHRHLPAIRRWLEANGERE
jgi:hypothetical protein